MADHVAILRKAQLKKGDNLLNDILSGEKNIESRWYVNRIPPWNQIFPKDTIYFKESGRLVTAKATVSRVLQFEDLTSQTIKQIINRYGDRIAPKTSKKEFLEWVGKKDKRYCILIFIRNIQKIKPFKIDKTGFGNTSAWLCVKNIDKVKIAD